MTCRKNGTAIGYNLN